MCSSNVDNLRRNSLDLHDVKWSLLSLNKLSCFQLHFVCDSRCFSERKLRSKIIFQQNEWLGDKTFFGKSFHEKSCWIIDESKYLQLVTYVAFMDQLAIIGSFSIYVSSWHISKFPSDRTFTFRFWFSPVYANPPCPVIFFRSSSSMNQTLRFVEAKKDFQLFLYFSKSLKLRELFEAN